MKKLIGKIRKHMFLFEELVKRDFKQRYQRTTLGVIWSVLSPLLTLLIMKIVFTSFFGRTVNHYTIYLFAGNIVMSFYREATKNGMTSLLQNASIITKINVPKYLFIFSKNVSAFINFILTVLVFFIFCALDHIPFTVHMFSLVIPIICLTIMNIGIGMILSILYVRFRDMSYLYDVFLTLLNYLSAIFYDLTTYPERVQRLFLMNPVYVYIKYFRIVVLDGHLPSVQFTMLSVFYAVVFFLIGSLLYKRFNSRITYYL